MKWARKIQNSLLVTVIFAFVCCSCASKRTMIAGEKDESERKLESHGSDIDRYKDYVKQNLKITDKIYSENYRICDYLVETEYGTKNILQLIDVDAVRSIAVFFEDQSVPKIERVMEIYHYVLTQFEYFPLPDIWHSIGTTLEIKKGDCKGFSLLLLSILRSIGIESYGGISNGHMWVNALIDGKWVILETDNDPVRKQIYQIPGFYERPLFKIYHDRSLKRVKKGTIENPD